MELRPIAGYEGHYSIAADGRVWSEPRRTPQLRRGKGTYPVKGRWLTNRIGTQGYPVVMLALHAKKKKVYIHRLLAEAFIPAPPGGERLEVNHINGVKNDNRLENLEWVTPAQNSQHAYDSGLRTPSRKLSDERAAEVRRRVAAGESQRSLEAEFGVSSATLSRLCQGKIYLPISNRRGEEARTCTMHSEAAMKGPK